MTTTEASIRCCLKGEYKLCLSCMNISLIQPNSNIPELVWPYRYIRRYGKSSSSFTFEAGRRCSSGDGVFTFSTPQGDLIFQKVQDMVKVMKDRERFSGGGQPVQRNSNSSVDTGIPNMQSQISSGQQRTSATRPPIPTPTNPEPEYAEYDIASPQPPPPIPGNRPNLHYDEPDLNKQGGAWKEKGVEDNYQRLASEQVVYDEPFTGPGMATLASEFNRLSAGKSLSKGQSDTYDHIGSKGKLDKKLSGQDDIAYDIPHRNSGNTKYCDEDEGQYDVAVSVSRNSGKPKSAKLKVEEGMYDEITPNRRQ